MNDHAIQNVKTRTLYQGSDNQNATVVFNSVNAKATCRRLNDQHQLTFGIPGPYRVVRVHIDVLFEL